MSTAYLLIAHGSRDPRPQAAMNRLVQIVRQRLASDQPSPVDPALEYRQLAAVGAEDATSVLLPRKTESLTAAAPGQEVWASRVNEVVVGTAMLEFAPLPLHEQIYEFGRRLSAAGIKVLKIVPLFLLRGKHVMEDIPEEVAKAQQRLQGRLHIDITNHVGEHQQRLQQLIEQRFWGCPTAGRLIVAHGSRRPRGNRMVTALGRSLGVEVAYWAPEPTVETQVIQLMQQGCSTLTILPYFLFPGGITDAIAHLTEELAERFPRVTFRLLPPLGATPELAELAVHSLVD